MKYFLFLCLFFALFSCDKPITPDINSVTRITHQGAIMTEVEYGKSNNILLLKDRSLNSAEMSYADNKLTKISRKIGYGSSSINLDYDIKYGPNNTVRIVLDTKDNPIASQSSNFFAFKNNLVIQHTYSFSYDLNGQPLNETSEYYTYDSNSNLIKAQTRTSTKIIETIEYENYDDKINPRFSNAMNWTLIGSIRPTSFGHPDLPISRNNPRVIKKTSYNYSWGEENKAISVDSIAYKYNQNDVPVEILFKKVGFQAFKIEYKK